MKDLGKNIEWIVKYLSFMIFCKSKYSHSNFFYYCHFSSTKSVTIHINGGAPASPKFPSQSRRDSQLDESGCLRVAASLFLLLKLHN